MSVSNSIRAVLFDLDGTLRFNEPPGFATLSRFLEEQLGHPLTPEQRHTAQRWEHFYWSIAPELSADIEELGADTPAFWMRYAERTIEALAVDDPQRHLALRVHARMAAEYRPVNRVPADVRPTLTGLRERGYVVALVSNRSEALDPMVADLNLDGLFAFTLSAGQAGAWKPAPEIFLRAVELAGCRPAEAAYVGDNFYADVEGARGAGLQPILIDPHGLFPDPGCPVIGAIGEVEALLDQPGTA